jgi:hypothetical protein
MTDWGAIAMARSIEIPAQDLDRIAPPLEALEQAFRPLVEDLPPDLEPAVEFRAEAEGE